MIVHWKKLVIPFSFWIFGNVAGLTLFIIYHIAFLLTFTSYSLTVATDPGSPDNGWEPNDFTKEELEKLKEKDIFNEGKARFCEKCNVFKPPRVHHCRILKRCILRMDHYCVWANNSIGLLNHKYFLNLLFWCSFTSFLSSVVQIIFIVSLFINKNFFKLENLLIMSSCSLSLVTFFAVGSLFLFYIDLAAKNLTVIEDFINRNKIEDMKKKGLIYSNPYDKGEKK